MGASGTLADRFGRLEKQIDAVRQASTILLEYFRQPLAVEFKEKGQQSPVTEADRRSEAALRETLRRAFPDHGIVGEEAEAGPQHELDPDEDRRDRHGS